MKAEAKQQKRLKNWETIKKGDQKLKEVNLALNSRSKPKKEKFAWILESKKGKLSLGLIGVSGKQ